LLLILLYAHCCLIIMVGSGDNPVCGVGMYPAHILYVFVVKEHVLYVDVCVRCMHACKDTLSSDCVLVPVSFSPHCASRPVSVSSDVGYLGAAAGSCC